MRSGESARERVVEPVAPQPSLEAPALPSLTNSTLDARTVLSLQRSAGNAAVSALVGERPPNAGGAVPPPRPPDPATLEHDHEIAVGLAATVRSEREAPGPVPMPTGIVPAAVDTTVGAIAMPTPSSARESNGAGAIPMPTGTLPATGGTPVGPVPMPTGIVPATAEAPVGAVPMPTPPGSGDTRGVGPVPMPEPTRGKTAAEPVPMPSAGGSKNGAATAPVAVKPARAAHSSPGGRRAAAAPAVATQERPGGDGAPAASGAPELDSWKAAVTGATNSIAGPKLDDVEAAPGALAAQAKATEQTRAAEKPDFPAQAREQLPPEPKPPAPAEQLDTAAADGALAEVDNVGKFRLSDQTFPAMAAMPNALVPPRPPTVLPPATGPDQAPSAVAGGPVRPDPNAHAAADKLAAAGPVAAGTGTAGGAVLSAPAPASLDPLPPAQAVHIGDVAARVLADAPAFAQQILDAATATLDPGKSVPAFVELAKDMSAPEQNGLIAELQGVAAAAGVSAEELQAKVAAKQAEASKAHAAAEGALDQRAAAANDAVKQRGDEELQQISGASIAVREEVTRKQEVAKGASDPSVVNGRRDAYLDKVHASSAASSARLRAAKERRIADLEKIGGEQRTAYRRQAMSEATRAGEGQDPAAKNAARPLLEWSDKQSLDVEGNVARLSRLAGEEVERFELVLKTTVEAARERIRDWAVEKQGRQRTWWDRLMDMVTDYMHKAVADNKAWEAQRNAETRDKVASDLTMLMQVRDDMKKGNRDAVLAQMARMSKEERAVFQAFMNSGGKDALGAVAAGLVERIKAHRIPELSKRIEETAIADLEWEELNKIGKLQSPEFDAGLLVREVRGSVNSMWGTDEDRLFAALSNRTPLQIAAMRKAYAKTYDRDMDEDIDDDVSGSEQERADALRTGNATAGAVASIEDAMDRAGTDEALIMETLRGKTPAQRDAIVAAYEKKYGKSLKSALASEMEDYELGQAEALLEGDEVKADAMAIKDAMDGAGTKEQAINAVYARIRSEVEAEADAKGMKTAEVEAEIKRRNDVLKRKYGDVLGDGDIGALERDYRDEMGGSDLKLVLAAQDGDQTAMDAAKLQSEHEGMWTSDENVNDILKAQYTRADKEVKRDLTVDFNKQAANMAPAERKAAWEQLKKQGDATASVRSKQYMGALETSFNQDAFNPDPSSSAFRGMIETGLSGYDRDEAKERIASGGQLSDENELYYAIYGPGTKEQRIRDVLKGKSKVEVEHLKLRYKALSGEELVDDLEGDLRGRDAADVLAVLKTGDSTLEEKRALLKERASWELDQGTGFGGDATLGEEEKVLKATSEEADRAFEAYETLKKDRGENDPATVEARERLERWLGYGDKDIDRHREEMDSVTDTIVLVAGVAVGIAVTVITAGVAGGAAVAGLAAYFGTTIPVMAAVVGAVSATAAGMLIKQGMKADAYGGEDIAVDLAQGTADTMVAVATLGVGDKALKYLSKAPALSVLKRLAEGGALKQLIFKAAESGVDGFVSGLPSGMMGAILNENTWKSGNPLQVILEAGGEGAKQGAKMGAATGPINHAASTVHSAIRSRASAAPADHGTTAPHTGETQPHASDESSVPAVIEDGPTQPHAQPEDPAPLTDPGAPKIEESPAGGFEPTTAEPPPEDWGPEPHEEELHPEEIGPIDDDGPPSESPPERHASDAPDDAPTGVHKDSPTGVFEDGPTGVHDESPTSEIERPTRVWNVPAERLPIMDLPAGTVMYSDRPLTRVEANHMYENAITDGRGAREAMVLENTRTGERVVIQGNSSRVGPARDSWMQFMAEGGRAGEWRAIRHYHPVGPDGVTTEPINRYPSGRGGDMSGARALAIRARQMHVETLDFVTEHGRETVLFGYDPHADRPFFVGLERPGGIGRDYHYFRSLEAYHDFVEQRTGERLPILGEDRRGGGTSRRSSDGQDAFDEAPTGEWDDPTNPEASIWEGDPTDPDIPVWDRPTDPGNSPRTPEAENAYDDLVIEGMSRDELDIVLEQIGQPRLEITQVTPGEAARLHTAMAGLTFTDASGVEVPVPYHYTVDGCWARAHMMANVMTAAGVASERIFATSTVAGSPLEVHSPYSPDQPGGGPPMTRWFYHVAPIVEVRTPNGIEKWVIDPSTQSTAVPVATWLATMGVAQGTYRQLTHEQLIAHLAAPHAGPRFEGFPVGERLVWTTDRNTMFPSDPPAADPSRAHGQLAENHPRMSEYAQAAAVHGIAAAVRAEMNKPGATAASVVAAIPRGAPGVQSLWMMFPFLRYQLVNRFPNDVMAIDAAVLP